MPATAKRVLEVATGFLGVKESPANSNNVIFNTHYYGREVSGSNYAWCAVFVWDVFRLAGAPELYYDGKKTAYVPTLVSWGKQSGTTVSKDAAAPGDIIIYDWNRDGSGDHVGILEEKRGSVFVVIEGNTAVGNNSNGGEVMRRQRDAADILCVIRPAYAAEPEKEMPEVEALRERIAELELAVEAMMRPKYHTVDDLPEWARPAIRKLIDDGLLRGVGEGNLDLSEDVLRLLVILQRAREDAKGVG